MVFKLGSRAARLCSQLGTAPDSGAAPPPGPGLQIPTGRAPRLRSPPLREEGEGAGGASEPPEEVVAAAAGDMDNAGKEREAVQLMAEAEKRVKASHSFLRGLFG